MELLASDCESRTYEISRLQSLGARILHIDSSKSLEAIAVDENWGKSHDAMFSEFVDSQKRHIDRTISAVAEYFESEYEDLREAGVELPKLDDLRIEEMITIDQVFLCGESNRWGVCGACVWDEEHGWGLVSEGDEVIAMGYANVAFEPANCCVASDRFEDTSLYSISIPSGSLAFNFKFTKTGRDLIRFSIELSQVYRVSGLFALFITHVTNAVIDQSPRYTLKDVADRYKFSLDEVACIKSLMAYRATFRRDYKCQLEHIKFLEGHQQQMLKREAYSEERAERDVEVIRKCIDEAKIMELICSLNAVAPAQRHMLHILIGE